MKHLEGIFVLIEELVAISCKYVLKCFKRKWIVKKDKGKLSFI